MGGGIIRLNYMCTRIDLKLIFTTLKDNPAYDAISEFENVFYALYRELSQIEIRETRRNLKIIND